MHIKPDFYLPGLSIVQLPSLPIAKYPFTHLSKENLLSSYIVSQPIRNHTHAYQARFLPAWAKHCTITITAYSQIPIYIPE